MGGQKRDGVEVRNDQNGHTIIWRQDQPDGLGHINLLQIDKLGTRLDTAWLPTDEPNAQPQRVVLITSGKNAQPEINGNIVVDGQNRIVEIGTKLIDGNPGQTPTTIFVNALLTYALRGAFKEV